MKEQELEGTDWITIANHPLGFHTLRITKKDLEAIVKLQCGGAYFRDGPYRNSLITNININRISRTIS